MTSLSRSSAASRNSYLDLGQDGDYWNPAKDWGTDNIEEIAQVLNAHGLVPTEEKPAC